MLTGARISYFDIDARTRTIRAAGPAYKRVYDRGGNLVTHPSQISELPDNYGGYHTYGFDRFCSAQGVWKVWKGDYGFMDDIFSPMKKRRCHLIPTEAPFGRSTSTKRNFGVYRNWDAAHGKT